MSSKLHTQLYFYDTCLTTFLPYNFFLLPVTSSNATLFKNRNFYCIIKYHNIYCRDNPCLYLKIHIRLLTRTSKNGTWSIFKDLIYCTCEFEAKAVLNIKLATKAIFDSSYLINNCREFTGKRWEEEGCKNRNLDYKWSIRKYSWDFSGNLWRHFSSSWCSLATVIKAINMRAIKKVEEIAGNYN